MAYITREDGEHFVIPSYRDVLTIKQKSQLKKEIYALSQNYGEYITLQKKSSVQYEVAFSNDTGYLLGESIWQQFKRPEDMIYCEAIPNTTEAIFVIAKSGTVYLDGRFPLDSIPEELVVFLTQKNEFEIYVYGDVPIAEIPEEGKFAFDSNAIKSFKRLDKPVFPTLPLLKIYQLQLVEPTLKRFGIGVFPTGQLITAVIIFAGLWAMWNYFTELTKVQPQEAIPINPYLDYISQLTTPDPRVEVDELIKTLIRVNSIPGWEAKEIDYDKQSFHINMLSSGGLIEDLIDWGNQNQMGATITQQGMILAKPVKLGGREKPKHIYPVQEILASFIDKLAAVYPGNHITLDQPTTKSNYTVYKFTINFQQINSSQLFLIAKQFNQLPLTLRTMKVTVNSDNTLSGTILMEAIGS